MISVSPLTHVATHVDLGRHAAIGPGGVNLVFLVACVLPVLCAMLPIHDLTCAPVIREILPRPFQMSLGHFQISAGLSRTSPKLFQNPPGLFQNSAEALPDLSLALPELTWALPVRLRTGSMKQASAQASKPSSSRTSKIAFAFWFLLP